MTTTYVFGDVILVPFIFTDLSVGKKRPAVVISDGDRHSLHGDLIILAITSTIRQSDIDSDWPLAGWAEAGLLKPSTFKPLILSIAPRMIMRQYGQLQPEDLSRLRRMLGEIFAHVLQA